MRDLDLKMAISKVLHPERLWTRPEIIAKPELVPRADGFYVWYFKNLEPHVPTQDCCKFESFRLLYVGIAPKDEKSRSSLQDRIQNHVSGTACNSTVRLSLGTLLHRELGLVPHRTPSGKKIHWGKGEDILSRWMDENARVVWTEWEEPRLDEKALIQKMKTPLNILKNKNHPFCAVLKMARKDLRDMAKGGVE